MNNRDFVRYGFELLTGNLSKATVSWEGGPPFESYVVNYSARGITLLMPALLIPPGLPKEKEILRVLLPIDQTWFSGRCIYLKKGADGSLSMGIHFDDPQQQSYLKDLLFHSLPSPRDSHSFVSYEWEELVAKLCASDDPHLQEVGRQHRANILADRDRPHPA
jgi:hypothetical protein